MFHYVISDDYRGICIKLRSAVFVGVTWVSIVQSFSIGKVVEAQGRLCASFSKAARNTSERNR